MSLAGFNVDSDVTATQRRHYSKPPVREALIEVAIEPPLDAERNEILQQLPDRLIGAFEAHRPIDQDALSALYPGGPGLEFQGGGGSILFRARTTGCSFHRLQPYSDWENWTPSAYTVIRQYLDAVAATRVKEVSVRYLNYIPLPAAGELSKYFQTFPNLAPGISSTVAGFFMQVVIPGPEKDVYVVLRQAQVPPPENAALQIVLDIQASAFLSVSTDTDLTPQVEMLHTVAIDTFERCITNRTRELFD